MRILFDRLCGFMLKNLIVVVKLKFENNFAYCFSLIVMLVLEQAGFVLLK